LEAVRKPNQIDVVVGGRIRLRRKILGMSQSALAQALGVTFQQVQKYEKGGNRVSASRLQAVASVLQVPVSFFFENNKISEGPFNSQENEVTSFLSTADGLALNRAFAKIEDVNIRRKIVRLVEVLSGVEAP